LAAGRTSTRTCCSSGCCCCCYAYGTNTGIRAVAAGDHPHSEDDLRYIRRRHVTIQACRDAARAIANATFAARHAWLWGQGTTAVASDSTHFSAFDQNIFTEWHSRYRRAKRGVPIYWTVDTAGAMAIHSQLLQIPLPEPFCNQQQVNRYAWLAVSGVWQVCYGQPGIAPGGV
jgi:TnpA family transposase